MIIKIHNDVKVLDVFINAALQADLVNFVDFAIMLLVLDLYFNQLFALCSELKL